MQSLSIFHAGSDGLRPATSDLGSASAELLRMKALHEAELKSIMTSMEENAVRRREQGNRAMEKGEFRHAVKEYSHALDHARDMVDFLEVEKSPAMNGYQLRALARGMPLPQRGPKALQPFRAIAFASRALAYLRLDAYAEAAEDAKAACELEPRYLKAWIRRACALAAMNRREEAQDVLKEALEKACNTDLLREQVCKLLVNLHNLVNVVVKPPEKDLPVIYKDSERPKKKKTWREVIAVPVAGPNGDATVSVPRHELRKFLQEDWKSTLSGRAIWAQTSEELFLVLRLPRRPKVSELRIEISPKHLLSLLRKKGVTSATQDDFDTLIDAKLLATVKPSECSWQLDQVGDSCDLHFSLRKHCCGMVEEAFQ